MKNSIASDKLNHVQFKKRGYVQEKLIVLYSGFFGWHNNLKKSDHGQHRYRRDIDGLLGKNVLTGTCFRQGS
jgi:hypothetical protein